MYDIAFSNGSYAKFDNATGRKISKLDALENSYFSKLDQDLFHSIYGNEIKALLEEVSSSMDVKYTFHKNNVSAWLNFSG